METEEKAGAFETIGAALAGAVVVILIYLVAITVWTTAARAGGYGEYSGQSWAERAMSGDHSRVRGKPQYEPGGGYYREHSHGDRYSRGNHRIKVHPHSHRHHRERGYSSVTHVHEVAHRHVYRPRYTHPRYTRHYAHWRPSYRPHWTRWQEHAAPRYAWVKVPLYSRDGHRVPERYRWDPDVRAAWERGYRDARREARYEDGPRYGYRDDPRDRYEGRRDCKPMLKHFGETRLKEDSAKAQAQVGWSAAVGLEYGLKYANIKNARKRPGWIECHVAGYKEEGVEKAIENFAKIWNRQDNWKSKCVVELQPCAPPKGRSSEEPDPDSEEPDGDHNEEPGPGPGPTR